VEVLHAARALKQDGITVRVISLACVQPIDADALFAMVGDARHVVCVEEHYISCGLGSIIAREWMNRRPAWQLHTLGIHANFIHEIKDTAGMREHFGISAKKIAEFIKGLERQ
jgi:transketolase